jgi:hypothetical protein
VTKLLCLILNQYEHQVFSSFFQRIFSILWRHGVLVFWMPYFKILIKRQYREKWNLHAMQSFMQINCVFTSNNFVCNLFFVATTFTFLRFCIHHCWSDIRSRKARSMTNISELIINEMLSISK